nr:hypothetical protein CFP56_31623 [Quercus suber]
MDSMSYVTPEGRASYGECESCSDLSEAQLGNIPIVVQELWIHHQLSRPLKVSSSAVNQHIFACDCHNGTGGVDDGHVPYRDIPILQRCYSLRKGRCPSSNHEANPSIRYHNVGGADTLQSPAFSHDHAGI